MTANERTNPIFDAVTGRGYIQGGLRSGPRNILPVDGCDSKLDRYKFLTVAFSKIIRVRCISPGASS
jgi:hypothetical protein